MGGKMIAIDFGASSGKMAFAEFDGDRLRILEYKNFANNPVNIGTALYWDVFSLYRSTLEGLADFRCDFGESDSVGIDTWGATFGLLDNRGRMLEPVYHYRDGRTVNVMEAMRQVMSPKELFFLSGCQPNRTYTLPQLFAYRINQDNIIDLADKLLFLPDLLGYFLSGEISTEQTIAGTSGLLDNSLEKWSKRIAREFKISDRIYTDICEPGQIKGHLRAEVSEMTGMTDTRLITAIGHDSASAVAAIPGFDKRGLYISLGTNISMGVETDSCLITEAAFLSGMKNTGGFGGKKIVYRDFSAFWHLNEFLSERKRQGIYYDYQKLIEMVEETVEEVPWIDVENTMLCNAGDDYIERMDIFYKQSSQRIPNNDAERVRSIFESVALKITYYAGEFENLYPCETVSAISGGIRNTVLLQMVCNALDKSVQAGLPYASLVGNLLSQAYVMQKTC